jgi:hypothetical protein
MTGVTLHCGQQHRWRIQNIIDRTARMMPNIVRANGRDDLKKHVMPHSPQSAKPPDGSTGLSVVLQKTTVARSDPSAGIGVDQPSSQKHEQMALQTAVPWLQWSGVPALVAFVLFVLLLWELGG